jgi:hypothetical protein
MRFRPANINYLEDYNLQRINQSKPFWTFVVDRLPVEKRVDNDEISNDDDDLGEKFFLLKTLEPSGDDEFHTFDDYDDEQDGKSISSIVRCKHCEISIINELTLISCHSSGSIIIASK